MGAKQFSTHQFPGFPKSLRYSMLVVLLAISLHNPAVRAEPLKVGTSPQVVKANAHSAFRLREFKYTKAVSLAGWQVTDNLYLGNTSIAGTSGPGLILDRGKYAYAINHRQVSITLKF